MPVHVAGTGEEIRNPLPAQVGQVRQGRAVTGDDQKACFLIPLMGPGHPAAAIHDGEPPRAAKWQVVRLQDIGRLVGTRKGQRLLCVGDEGAAALQEHGGMVALLDSGLAPGQQVGDVRRPRGLPPPVRAGVQQPLGAVEGDTPVGSRSDRDDDPGASDAVLANGIVRWHGGNGNAES